MTEPKARAITESPEAVTEPGALQPTAAEFKAALERAGLTPDEAAASLRGFVEAIGERGSVAHSLTAAMQPDPEGVARSTQRELLEQHLNLADPDPDSPPSLAPRNRNLRVYKPE